jgi:hypothetical protein
VLQRVGEVDLGGIEVPVTVCWFPEETGEGSNPHGAARKLFVDVNKEARPPSKSRIILLSDAELSNVLTRRMLSELRNGGNDALLPIYAVEYDNPETNSTQPARWSVLTNIHLLKLAVDRCVFGPEKYLRHVDQKFGGRLGQKDMDEFMSRQQLDLASVFPEPVEDGGFTYAWEEIGNQKFPLGHVDAISDRFAETWGRAILTLLSVTAPYRAHAEALTRVKDEWYRDDSGHLSLPYDALFNGVGVYWTLRDSHQHYQEQRQLKLSPLKSDVIRAWETLVKREELFDSYRAQCYLGTGRAGALKQSKAAFAVFNTHACQLGMVMTLGTLWELRKQQPGGADLSDLPKFAEAVAAAWNAYFALEHGKSKDRRLAFNKSEVTAPLNVIANMDTPQAVYFRYFWLQMLDIPEAWAHMEPWFSERTAFERVLSDARGLYFELCVDQQYRALKTTGTPDGKLHLEAERLAGAALGRSLRDWFYGSDEPFQAWKIEYSEKDTPRPEPAAADGGTLPEQLRRAPEPSTSAADLTYADIDDLLGE